MFFMIQNQFNYLLIILYHFEFEFFFLGDFFFVYKNKFIRISRHKFQKFKNMICINLRLRF